MYQYFHKKWISTTRNVLWAANQHFRMVSEGSCDTEEWSNEFRFDIKKYILKCIIFFFKYCNNISQYYYFYSILNQINTALVSIRYFLQKQTNYTNIIIHIEVQFISMGFVTCIHSTNFRDTQTHSRDTPILINYMKWQASDVKNYNSNVI